MEVLVHWTEVRKYDFTPTIVKQIKEFYGEVNRKSIEAFIANHDNIEKFEIKKESYGWEIVDVD